MADINSNVSVTQINEKTVNSPIKKQRFSHWI